MPKNRQTQKQTIKAQQSSNLLKSLENYSTITSHEACELREIIFTMYWSCCHKWWIKSQWPLSTCHIPNPLHHPHFKSNLSLNHISQPTHRHHLYQIPLPTSSTKNETYNRHKLSMKTTSLQMHSPLVIINVRFLPPQSHIVIIFTKYHCQHPPRQSKLGENTILR